MQIYQTKLHLKGFFKKKRSCNPENTGSDALWVVGNGWVKWFMLLHQVPCDVPVHSLIVLHLKAQTVTNPQSHPKMFISSIKCCWSPVDTEADCTLTHSGLPFRTLSEYDSPPHVGFSF